MSAGYVKAPSNIDQYVALLTECVCETVAMLQTFDLLRSHLQCNVPRFDCGFAALCYPRHIPSTISSMADRVSILADDMFFAAKINSAASACGREVERIKSREQLEALASNAPSLVIIDLNSDRLDPFEAIEFLKSRAELSAVPIVSFVSHVQTDLIRRAQAAGCDFVLPRSAFTQMLLEIVSGNLGALTRRAQG